MKNLFGVALLGSRALALTGCGVPLQTGAVYTTSPIYVPSSGAVYNVGGAPSGGVIYNGGGAPSTGTNYGGGPSGGTIYNGGAPSGGATYSGGPSTGATYNVN